MFPPPIFFSCIGIDDILRILLLCALFSYSGLFYQLILLALLDLFLTMLSSPRQLLINLWFSFASYISFCMFSGRRLVITLSLACSSYPSFELFFVLTLLEHSLSYFFTLLVYNVLFLPYLFVWLSYFPSYLLFLDMSTSLT